MGKCIRWKEDGWTVVQDADAEKHILEISCRSEKGNVVEARIRHNDGEEVKGTVKYDGKDALPMEIKRFKKLFSEGLLEIK